MAQSLPQASALAHQKTYVTYTAPYSGLDAMQVTLLEVPSLLASSGTTGFRTWEAALFLGAYLASVDGKHLVNDQCIIELGSGTGFLSIFCSKHLGARRVLATDGSREVITDLETNLALNELENFENIQAAVLQWGHTLVGSPAHHFGFGSMYDILLGADVVCVLLFGEQNMLCLKAPKLASSLFGNIVRYRQSLRD